MLLDHTPISYIKYVHVYIILPSYLPSLQVLTYPPLTRYANVNAYTPLYRGIPHTIYIPQYNSTPHPTISNTTLYLTHYYTDTPLYRGYTPHPT